MNSTSIRWPASVSRVRRRRRRPRRSPPPTWPWAAASTVMLRKPGPATSTAAMPSAAASRALRPGSARARGLVPRLLGQLERDVGGVVAVTLLARSLHGHARRDAVGQRDGAVGHEVLEHVDDGRGELVGGHRPSLSAPVALDPNRFRRATSRVVGSASPGASVAQGIEHWFPVPGAAGSNPAGGAREQWGTSGGHRPSDVPHCCISARVVSTPSLWCNTALPTGTRARGPWLTTRRHPLEPPREQADLGPGPLPGHRHRTDREPWSSGPARRPPSPARAPALTDFGFRADVYGVKLVTDNVEAFDVKDAHAQLRCTRAVGQSVEKTSAVSVPGNPLDPRRRQHEPHRHLPRRRPQRGARGQHHRRHPHRRHGQRGGHPRPGRSRASPPPPTRSTPRRASATPRPSTSRASASSSCRAPRCRAPPWSSCWRPWTR